MARRIRSEPEGDCATQLRREGFHQLNAADVLIERELSAQRAGKFVRDVQAHPEGSGELFSPAHTLAAHWLFTHRHHVTAVVTVEKASNEGESPKARCLLRC